MRKNYFQLLYIVLCNTGAWDGVICEFSSHKVDAVHLPNENAVDDQIGLKFCLRNHFLSVYNGVQTHGTAPFQWAFQLSDCGGFHLTSEQQESVCTWAPAGTVGQLEWTVCVGLWLMVTPRKLKCALPSSGCRKPRLLNRDAFFFLDPGVLIALLIAENLTLGEMKFVCERNKAKASPQLAELSKVWLSLQCSRMYSLCLRGVYYWEPIQRVVLFSVVQ